MPLNFKEIYDPPIAPELSADVQFVSSGGSDGLGGTDFSTGKATIASAIAMLTNGGTVRVGDGQFTTSLATTLDRPLAIKGNGMNQTTFYGGVGSGYVFQRFNTGTTIDAMEFSDFTVDLNNTVAGSGFFLEYVKNVIFRRVRFKNCLQWMVYIGVLNGADSTVRNTNIIFEDCIFDTQGNTTECLLLANSRGVTVRNCHFLGIGASAYGVGLYQNLQDVTLDTCTLEGAGSALYYSLSTNDIIIQNSQILTGRGVLGANQSDNGAFGYTFCRNVRSINNRFTTSGGSFAFQFGAVYGGLSVGNIFYRCYNIGMIIDDGNTPVSTLPKGISLIGDRFIENNQQGTAAALHPGLYINPGANTSDLDLILSACEFFDDQATNTQIYPIVFDTYQYGKLAIIGNHIKAGTGGVSILPANGATVLATSQIHSNLDYTGAGLGGLSELYTPQVATTANRPTTGLRVGLMMYDSTLAAPIWYNGSVWKDAAGNTV